MISKNLSKRILTSGLLFCLLFFMYKYTYILIVSLILISIISWIEFYALLSKIFYHDNLNDHFWRFFSKSFSLIYLTIFTFSIFYIKSKNYGTDIYIIYSLCISIATDIGGLIFGKIIKGKKLTKISPNKTISGSMGSFIFSLLLIPFFIDHIATNEIWSLIIITVLISLISQIGDLFISFLKRKAQVKDTSDLLPGHGGVLDRIDGILFAIPAGLFLFTIFDI